jgi:membrane-associated phospholipid phosphatase
VNDTTRKPWWAWPLPVRAGIALAVTFAFLAVPAMADQWVYAHWYRANIYDLDWARMLRILGFWPTWAILALVLWLHQKDVDRPLAKRRALLLAGAPAASGILCEIVKLLIRRERPDVGAGEWVFRPWSEHTFSTAGLATPSSHTMVAFAGMTIAARLFPRAKWMFYFLAWGCGITRILAHAHFLSDVTFGAILGWAVGWGIWIEVRKKTGTAK